MNCETAGKLLDFYLYGELSFEQEQLVEEHLAACAACRRELEKTRALHELLNEGASEPVPELLTGCRRELRARLQAMPEAKRAWLLAWFRPSWALRAAAAVVLVALGFFTARWTASRPATGALDPSADPLAARIRFVEQDPDGRVRIGIDETRRRTVRGRPEDEPIQRWLVAAAREAADPGLRLDSVNLLGARAQQESVRRALLDAVRRDPNPGVRLKALEALKPFAGQLEVREVLAQVLLSDENPGVRIQAIDLLIEQRRRDELVGLLQEVIHRENNDYVRLRCRQALEELNASVGTF